MKKLKPIVFASLLLLAFPLMAQDAHQHHGVAATETPALAEISPAPAGKGGCEKCKTMGTGDKLAHGDGMVGMMGCKGMHFGEIGGKSCCGGMRGGDTVALEQRIAELEKRLDQMQQQKPR